MPRYLTALLYSAAAAAAARTVATSYYAPACLFGCSGSNPIIRFPFVSAKSASTCSTTGPCAPSSNCNIRQSFFPGALNPTGFINSVLFDASSAQSEVIGSAYLPAVRSGSVCASSDSVAPRMSYTLTSLAPACNTTLSAFRTAELQFWDDVFQMPPTDWITPNGVLYANFPLEVEPRIKRMLASNGPSSGSATSNSFRSLVIAVSEVGTGQFATTISISPNVQTALGSLDTCTLAATACLNGCYVIPPASYPSIWPLLLSALVGKANVCS